MTRGGDSISTTKAILIGMIWVNGAALLGMVLPGAILLGAAALMSDGPLSPFIAAAGLVGIGLLGFVCGWLAWATQVTGWRLWAYRRVDDVGALKTAAVTAGLLWPEGHPFERTEFRNRDQSIELARLEQRSGTRAVQGRATPEPAPTAARTAGKALLLGLILTPAGLLAPAGFLSMAGVEVANSPIFLALLLIFPLALAGLIYRRARKEGVSADEGLRRMLPAALRTKKDGE